MRHTLYWDRGPAAGTPVEAGTPIEITGDEATHVAKSKRLREGEHVRAVDGRGLVTLCAMTATTKSCVHLEVVEAAIEAPVRPMIEVCTATPKGQRMDKMLDMLGQCGAAAWRPLTAERGVVEPGANKLDRARRISVEAMKQCGRAHAMVIDTEIGFEEALRFDGLLVIAEAGGVPPHEVGSLHGPVRLLVGPEGGFTDEERTLAREARAVSMRLGVHVLRIETAAVVGVGGLMALRVPGA